MNDGIEKRKNKTKNYASICCWYQMMSSEKQLKRRMQKFWFQSGRNQEQIFCFRNSDNKEEKKTNKSLKQTEKENLQGKQMQSERKGC